MRTRSFAAQHDAAVSRRLELLSTELAAVREQDAAAEGGVLPASASSPEFPRIRAVPDLVDGGPAGRSAQHSLSEPGDEHGQAWGPVLPAGPSPVAVLLPGRHASRRPASWSDLLPEGLRGRVVLGGGQVAVVAVLVAIGLALTCWWLLRSGDHEVTAPLVVTTPSGALATPGSSGGSASPVSVATQTGGPAAAKVVVDVTGKVRRPGIVVLRQGARIVDALRAAGGARPGVDLGGLNLAEMLTDGEQVVVGPSAPVPVPGGSAPTGGSPGALVDLNTADETTLESLPDVGPVTAGAIITWRTQHGAFTSVDQLLDVDGIGDATLAKLTPLVTI